MKKKIEFVKTSDAVVTDLFRRAKVNGKPPYEDLLLNHEYEARRLVFPRGKTCVRILPQIVGDAGWMQGVQVLNHPNGRHAKSLEPRALSVFDTAYGWLKANEPNLLFSKANRDGYRLLPSSVAVCWLLVEMDGEMVARVFVGSAYDGVRGGNCGIADQLFRIARELGEPGGHDAAHSEYGVQITVEKTIPLGDEYPTYKMTRHSVAAPIDRYLDRMSETEVNAICPLHEVIRSVDPNEEWELLAKITGTDLRDKIRDAPKGATCPLPSSDEARDERFT